MGYRRLLPVVIEEPIRWNIRAPLPLGPITEADKARFFEKVGEPDENGCRVWRGTCSYSGHGRFGLNGRTVNAHRVAWEIVNGPTPDGLLCLHKCDNPPCVNIIHLFIGTNKDNTDDMIAKGRKVCLCGEEKGSILTAEQVRQIFQLFTENKLTQNEIAKKFGVAREVISHINKGDSWRHLAPDGWQPAEPVWAKGERVWAAKLTEDEVREIYGLAWSGTYTLKEIGKMFGVLNTTVCSIKHRRNWKHLWTKETETLTTGELSYG